VKFLADMPISPKTVGYLRSIGHDVYRINERGLPKAKDREIVDIAEDEQRIILTMDLDFPAIIATSRKSTPSAIIFRLSDESHETVNSLLSDILPKVERELLNGAIVIIEDDRYRVRELPVS
jgi:predicted nuclease of predicted toxin-antitoxin system